MPANPLKNPNWAADLTSTVDRYVGLVRDNATVKLVKVVRAVVYGTLAAIAGLVAAVLAAIGATRLLQRLIGLLPGMDSSRAVWLTYLVMAALLLTGGGLLMRSRHTREA